jgi:hypothetical protein
MKIQLNAIMSFVVTTICTIVQLWSQNNSFCKENCHYCCIVRIVAILMTNQNILFSIVLICFYIASILFFIAISIVICFVVGIVKKISFNIVKYCNRFCHLYYKLLTAVAAQAAAAACDSGCEWLSPSLQPLLPPRLPLQWLQWLWQNPSHCPSISNLTKYE